jgi:hypothetical protein
MSHGWYNLRTGSVMMFWWVRRTFSRTWNPFIHVGRSIVFRLCHPIEIDVMIDSCLIDAIT